MVTVDLRRAMGPMILNNQWLSSFRAHSNYRLDDQTHLEPTSCLLPLKMHRIQTCHYYLDRCMSDIWTNAQAFRGWGSTDSGSTVRLLQAQQQQQRCNCRFPTTHGLNFSKEITNKQKDWK